MNQIVNLNTASTLTMSSREIAELTGKRHDNVMRDATVMLTELCGVGGLLSFEGTYRNEQNGQLYPCFNLPKREIAKLTGKLHDNVRRDIRNMAEELSLNFEEKVAPSTGGRPSREYLLPKRETLILVQHRDC